MRRFPPSPRLRAALAAAAFGCLAAPAAMAGYCADDAPFVYVWGQDAEGAYYHTGAIEIGAGETAADLVAVFAEKARAQYGVVPAAKPSPCFSDESEALAHRDRRADRQSGGGHREVEW